MRNQKRTANIISHQYGGRGTSVTSSRAPSIASFQHGVLESRLTWMFPEASLRTWMPAIHAGMTKFVFSFSVDERKVMNHFVGESLNMNGIFPIISNPFPFVP